MRDRARSAHRWDAEARRAAGALGTALRAGRNRRREMLAVARRRRGRPGAPAVGRHGHRRRGPPAAGRRAVRPGDPRRGVAHRPDPRRAGAGPRPARARRRRSRGSCGSCRFVADVDVAATLGRHGIDDRVDVRRVSAYDLAAQAAPVTWLDVHFRCAPHLIGFSAERFYEGRVDLATRHPRVESTDVIEVVPVADAVVADGVNAAEVDRGRRGRAAAGRGGAPRHRRGHPVPRPGRRARGGADGGLPGRRDRTARAAGRHRARLPGQRGRRRGLLAGRGATATAPDGCGSCPTPRCST